ncbi:MAG: PHP domain-containing protein [Desulfovibrionaceae bacterium]
MSCIDLHTHTLASDGTDSPAQLVCRAKAAGLCAVAITDHDTVAGLPEAEQQGAALDIEVVRGCEISARGDGGEIHILALWLPTDTTVLERSLSALREHRDARNVIIVEKLQALGLGISYEEVTAASQGEAVGRPHIAKVLINKGFVRDWQEAFVRYLGYKGQAYVPKEILSPEDAVSLLAGMGATVSLAHPCLSLASRERVENCVRQLKEYGLSAIEAYHSDHSQAEQRFCVDVAARYGLALTGGSDYHGTAKARIALGTGYGGLRVPRFVLDNLKTARRCLGLPV